MGLGYMLIPVALVVASIVLPRYIELRPGVFVDYSLYATTQSSALYVGSAPGRRVEFQIDFAVGTLYNFFNSVANDDKAMPVSDLSDQLAQNPVMNRILWYRTSHTPVPFVDASANVLSARALSHQFGQISFCHGYVFVGDHVPKLCARNKKLAEFKCTSGVSTCPFTVSIETPDGLYTRHAAVFSVTNEQTIIPHKFAGSGTIRVVNESVFTNGPVTIDTPEVVSGGDRVVLALRTMGSSMTITSDDTVTIYAAITDDVNSEAIAYTVLLILVFGYWVQTSQPLLSSEMINTSNDGTGPSVTESRTTRFIVGNTSFSLLMGSVTSYLKWSAYSHQYSPIETDVVLGAYGPSSSNVIPIVLLVINCAITVLVVCVILRPGPVRGPVQFALRSAFEVQLLLNLVLTVPPPAGKAFRLAFGAFCGTLLAFVLGRDACVLCTAAPELSYMTIVTFSLIFPLSLAVVCTDLIVPLVWSLRMASINEAPIVAAAWATNACATGALFYIMKMTPVWGQTHTHSSIKFRDLKASTKFL